jgi:hypothetical protein
MTTTDGRGRVVIDQPTLEMIAAILEDDFAKRREQNKRLWEQFYCVDSVKKLLERSERLQQCECEAACFRDIEGPKVILRDTLKGLEELLYDGIGDSGMSAECFLKDILREGGAE